MAVDLTIMRLNRDTFKENMDDYPKDLLQCVALSLLRRTPSVSQKVFASGLDGYLEPESSNGLNKSWAR